MSVSNIRTEIAVNKLNYTVKLQRSLSVLNGKGNEAFTINLNQHLYAGGMDATASYTDYCFTQQVMILSSRY